MDAVERRAEKRVRPPGDAVLEFALWPAPPAAPARLPLAELGRPAASRRDGCRLVVADISAQGIGLTLDAPAAILDPLAAVPAFFLYLRLREYRPQTEGELLSLFFHAATARLTLSAGRLQAGLRFLRLGRGSPFDKALEFVDVSRFGAPGLASWIDAVVRGELRPDHDPAPGLNLDRLLDEPDVSGPLPAQGQDSPP
ncbi:hypothetical protein DVDV_2484 [Desulfovibrio sp. DV]|uniref:hypothetical protein n=1 Tax=Desulfovibrio sp. DV TaxID=1844708 RepID=UPI00094B9DB4|nr:hypothetical protein [Desulfovibrio sp. DV]OLN26784.1 hypothetical protein DVDV_2484 [Desulfovibrio sp. DV]